MTKDKKSYKREVAFLLLLYILSMGAGWIGSQAALETMMWPILSFASIAFGLEGWRQVNAANLANVEPR